MTTIETTAQCTRDIPLEILFGEVYAHLLAAADELGRFKFDVADVMDHLGAAAELLERILPSLDHPETFHRYGGTFENLATEFMKLKATEQTCLDICHSVAGGPVN